MSGDREALPTFCSIRPSRVLHLEFAAAPHLPDGYAWHDFLPGLPAA
jgi:hypothetical protein